MSLLKSFRDYPSIDAILDYVYLEIKTRYYWTSLMYFSFSNSCCHLIMKTESNFFQAGVWGDGVCLIWCPPTSNPPWMDPWKWTRKIIRALCKAPTEGWQQSLSPWRLWILSNTPWNSKCLIQDQEIKPPVNDHGSKFPVRDNLVLLIFQLQTVRHELHIPVMGILLQQACWYIGFNVLLS